jgi:hypothetical protein
VHERSDNATWETLLGDEKRAIALRQKARAVAAALEIDDATELGQDPAEHRAFRAAWRARRARDLSAPIARTLLLVSVAVALSVLVYGLLTGGSRPLLAVCAAYAVMFTVGAKLASRRSRRPPPEHVGRVREQLDRVRSTLDSE